MPNPWDVGSARVLEALGFQALATTSSGFAFTLGRLDGTVTLDEMIEHAAALDRATDLPVWVDLENGYGPEPEHAALASHGPARPGPWAARSRTSTALATCTRSDTRPSGSPLPRRRPEPWVSRSATLIENLDRA
jgi:hypothetical protein